LDNIFANNLISLKKTDLPLYKKLKQIETNASFEVFAPNTNDLGNANILDTKDNTLLYSGEPAKQIQSKFEELNPYKWHRYLYFFGIGNGFLFKKLLKNKLLNKVRIIEPEIELIYIALNLCDFSKEILSKRVVFHIADDISFSHLWNDMDGNEKVFFKSYNLFVSLPFYEKYSKQIIKANEEILTVFKYYINAAGNDCKDELTGLKQFLKNLPLMLKNPSLEELIKKSKTADTAIIIATGPSLSKQLSLLKDIQDKAVLISVDASLPILMQWDIKPDIAISIERVEATAKFYKNLSNDFQKDIIFSISAIANQKLINSIKNGTLQLSMRSTGTHYKFFEFNKWGYVGEGMSSANLAYELASKIGYKTIVLIGQDLAFAKSGESHAKGHIFGENEVKNSSDTIYTEAYGGNGKIKTGKIWNLFRKSLENMIYKNNLAKKTMTINATEGGARIKGAQELSFKQICKKLQDGKVKNKIILNPPAQKEYEANIKKMDKKIKEAFNIGKAMQKRAKKLIDEIRRYEKDKKQKNEKMKKLIEEIRNIRAKYYGGSFYSFYSQLLSPLILHIEFDIYKITTMPENSEEEIKKKNQETILIHYEWLSRILLNLEKILEILKAPIHT